MNRKIHYVLVTVLGLSALLTACDERVIGRSETQYFMVNDFTNTIVSTLHPLSQYPSRLKVRIKGALDKPVIMTVFSGTNPAMQKQVLRDTIRASPSVNYSFDEDFYQNDTLQLTLSGNKSTTGTLSVEWSRN